MSERLSPEERLRVLDERDADWREATIADDCKTPAKRQAKEAACARYAAAAYDALPLLRDKLAAQESELERMRREGEKLLAYWEPPPRDAREYDSWEPPDGKTTRRILQDFRAALSEQPEERQ